MPTLTETYGGTTPGPADPNAALLANIEKWSLAQQYLLDQNKNPPVPESQLLTAIVLGNLVIQAELKLIRNQLTTKKLTAELTFE